MPLPWQPTTMIRRMACQRHTELGSAHYFRRWGELCNGLSSPFADVTGYSRLSSDAPVAVILAGMPGSGLYGQVCAPGTAPLPLPASDGFMPSLPVHWIGAEHRQPAKFHFW